MANTEQEIFDFTVQVRYLIKKYGEMKEELRQLKSELEAQKRETAAMETLANASMRDYEILKTAKMLEIGDNDLAATKKRVNKLIRDVAHCSQNKILLKSEGDYG